MAKNVPLYVFSGTGNTLMAAREFERQAVRFGLETEIKTLSGGGEETGFDRIDAEADLIGLFYPVLGFGAPRSVIDWVRSLPKGEGRRFFLLLSAAGGEVDVNSAAAGKISRLLVRRGYEVPYVRILKMGSNWLVRFPDDFTRDLMRVLPAKCADAAEAVAAGEKRRLPKRPLLNAMTSFVSFHEDQFGARLWGRLLKANENCNGCGLCVKRCPMENITKDRNGRVSFGWNCQWCMRCVYGCPQKAIIPRFLKSAVLEGGYDPKAIGTEPDTGEPREKLEKLRKQSAEYLENPRA